MTYYVSVQNGEANRYTATVVGRPDCVAEGVTEQEAVSRVKQVLEHRLLDEKIVPIEVEVDSPLSGELSKSVNSSWLQFAGMYHNNPLFDEVLSEIEQYRGELDAEMGVE